MLAKRIIPTLLCKGRTLIKGERFNAWRSIGHVAQGVMVHARRGVDELVLLDIAATTEGRGPDLDLIRELTESIFIPLTVGGGVRTLDDINALLRAGADKIVIGTAIHEVSGIIPRAAAHFGNQAIVASIDAIDGLDGTWGTAFRCGLNATFLSPVVIAELAAGAGAGEILLQNVSRDGTMQGYDLELIRRVSAAVDVPVIASGGCSGYENMHEAFKAGADACAAGAMWAFEGNTPKRAAEYLKKQGLEVRL